MENLQKILLSLCVGCLLFASFIWRVAGDVPDGRVRTDLNKSIKKGDDIVLNCEFYRSPIAVYWKKGDEPDTADNLLIWVNRGGVGQTSGPCTEDIRCDMASNYTLTIRDARIEDEGRYICRVSNYLGILIYNQTDVKIFAPPKEPFPTINQCTDTASPGLNATEPSCRVLTNTTIVLTCSVTNYYPQIDLFFLHGSQKMNAVAKELGNDDGTKNKSISIEAQLSQTQYICVASGIPGTGEQQAATIFVGSLTGMPSVTGTNRAFTTGDVRNEERTGNRAAKIVVPLFVLILLGAIAVFLRLKRLACFRQNTFDDTETMDRTIARNDGQESIPMIEKGEINGDISFYELWSLAYDTPSSDMKQLHQVLLNLDIDMIEDAAEEMGAPDVYNLLCKWKDKHKKDKHVNLLQSALQKANFWTRWQNLCEQRKRTDEKVSRATVEQIILDIADPQKFQDLLRKLYAGRADLPRLHGKIKDQNEAIELFMEWRCSRFGENPNAVLSLALAKSGCLDISKNFFPGMISFHELWKLSRMMGENEREANATLETLSLEVGDRLTEEEIYYILCVWKEKNTTANQGKLLLDALTKANFREAWKDIMDFREKKDDVADKTIEHILWQIKDPDKLGRFLQKLTGKVPCFDVSQTIQHNTIQNATKQVVEWKNQVLDENPIILLSYALEKTECTPIDRSFFKVKHHLTGDLIESEVEGFTDRLTSRHVKSLLQYLDIDMKEDTIVTANKATLFNTQAMVNDWISQAACSNYEKRLKLREAVVSIGRHDMKDEFWKDLNPDRDLGIQHGTKSSGHVIVNTMKTPEILLSGAINDELRRIAACLPLYKRDNVKRTFGKHQEDANHANCANMIGAYVSGCMTKLPKEDVEKKLREKLKSAKIKDLLTSRSDNVGLCELLDIAFRLLLEDVYPLAKALGISDETLTKYRVQYAPEHLTKGTTAVLIKLNDAIGGDRKKLSEVLSKIGYEDIAVLIGCGYETSLVDAFALVKKSKDNQEALTRISKNLGLGQRSNVITMIRDWKFMVHPPSYNSRTSLADAIYPIHGKDIADGILFGTYLGDCSQNAAVFQELINDIECFEPPLVRKILEVRERQKSPDQALQTHNEVAIPEDDIHRTVDADKAKEISIDSSTDPTSERIKLNSGKEIESDHADDVAKYRLAVTMKLAQILDIPTTKIWEIQDISLMHVLETWEEMILKEPLTRDEAIELSNKLLKAGFKELALEIMIGFTARSKKQREKDKANSIKHVKGQHGESLHRDHQSTPKPKVGEATNEDHTDIGGSNSDIDTLAGVSSKPNQEDNADHVGEN